MCLSRTVSFFSFRSSMTMSDESFCLFSPHVVRHNNDNDDGPATRCNGFVGGPISLGTIRSGAVTIQYLEALSLSQSAIKT